MHTVFTSAASLAHVGNILAESFYETIFKFASYYIRIAIISVSHFLYAFSVGHHLDYLILLLLTGGVVAFFYFRKSLDDKTVTA